MGNGGTNVGAIYYDVSLDTRQLIDGQRQVDRELKKTSGSLEAFGGKVTAIASAVGVLAAALAKLKIAELADEMRLLQARVQVASGSIDQGSAAFKRLVDMSRNTQTSLAGNVEVFNRLNQSIIQMGGNQNDTLRVTELLGKAIKVSGASAEEAKSAMIQFGQALGSGRLQGDELRSLMENAPYLMQQLAAGIGVPIGALKKLGEEGKLTSDVVVNALSKAAGKIEDDFRKFPQTIGGAMQVARDAAALAALQYDELTGGSRALAGATKGLGEVLDELGKQFSAANDEANKLGRNQAIQSWADTTKQALSYLVDAADLTWQTLSVLGRNVGFVFETIGASIGGNAAIMVAQARRDYAGAAAIRKQMEEDAISRRRALDAADQKTLGRSQLAGEKMRQAWASPQADYSHEGRGAAGAPSKLKAPVDDDALRKLRAKTEAAKSYYQDLVASNLIAIERIDAEEKKALADNLRRAAEDKNNQEIYAKARVEIAKKYARERGLVEERSRQEIADLSIAGTVDEMGKIAAIREEALRRADASVLLGVKTQQEGERAKVAANMAAAEAYAELAERNARARADAEITITKDQSAQIALIRDEAIRQAQDGYERGKLSFDEAEQAKTRAMQQAEDARKALGNQRDSAAIMTLQYKAGSGGTADQEALITAQAEAALKAVEEARLRDIEASQLYADQKVAIEEDMNRRIADMRANANMAALGSTADAFGAILNVMQKAGKEQSGVFKAIFLAQKAFSIAQSIVAIQTGIANAASLPWPANLAAMASTIAATASIVSTISSTNYGGGRQYGGPVSAGSMYRVNETGKPEMFTAGNGTQYMMPTANGSVTPADGVGGKVQVLVHVTNTHPTAQVTAQTDDTGRIVQIAVAEVAGQISSNSGPVWSAMRGATNVQGRL